MTKQFAVTGMTCAACSAHVERAVAQLPATIHFQDRLRASFHLTFRPFFVKIVIDFIYLPSLEVPALGAAFVFASVVRSFLGRPPWALGGSSFR